MPLPGLAMGCVRSRQGEDERVQSGTGMEKAARPGWAQRGRWVHQCWVWDWGSAHPSEGHVPYTRDTMLGEDPLAQRLPRQGSSCKMCAQSHTCAGNDIGTIQAVHRLVCMWGGGLFHGTSG